MQLPKILLSGLGLIALTSSAYTDTGNLPSPVAGPAIFWQDTQTQKYHCKGKGLIRCETAGGGTCITMHPCEAYCFLHDDGAVCVDMGMPPVPKIPVSAAEAKIAARAASSEKNEHNECFKDRTGVLICRYGFCSTDYYCKAGNECKDDSFSCAPKSLSTPRTRSEVRGVPPQAEAATLGLGEKPSYVCSKDRASVLKCFYRFCSINYYCPKRHSCADNPARCRKASSARTEQYRI